MWYLVKHRETLPLPLCVPSNQSLVGFDTVLCCDRITAFQRNLLPPSSLFRVKVEWYPAMTLCGITMQKTLN